MSTNHGSSPIRGLVGTRQSSIQTAKFGRMFRWLGPCFLTSNPQEVLQLEQVLAKLAKLMVSDEFNKNIDDPDPNARRSLTPDTPIDEIEPEDENPEIPAGYTYLGQFIDHDITFDPASSLQQQNDPDALEDFRTPRLDLDSIYGRGPADQPYLYKRVARSVFVLGLDRGVHGMNRPDLQRTGDGTAIIGDKRNDENKIVAQFQALFLKFHNKVYDAIQDHFTADQTEARFAEAQRIVRWCYQWIVLNDYLPRVCDPKIVQPILDSAKDRKPSLRFYSPHDGNAYIPVEFSVAAFRFGHSMVRPSYALNDTAKSTATFTSHKGTVASFSRIPIFVAKATKSTDALNGFGTQAPELPDNWGIDWAYFFGKMGTAKPKTPQIPQPSYRIDSTLVDPLGALPEFVASNGLLNPIVSLAYRNLLRGMNMSLPSGQTVARMMNAKVLSEEELWECKGKGDAIEAWPEGKAFYADAPNQRWLKECAPLWFYILKEAEITQHGRCLGEVGSRIVAETIIGLVWYDRYSYLFQEPRWTPASEGLDGISDQLDMEELTKYVG